MPFSSRIDPVFNLPTPLVFGHRGSVAEVPESTRVAFAHAIAHGCQVLELDIQLTADDRFVVWHGPSLDNVQVTGVPSDLRERDRLQKRLVYQFDWAELDGRTRVVDPGAPLAPDDGSRPADRRILLLEDFLALVNELDPPGQKIALNIEPKRDLRRRGDPDIAREPMLERLVDILDRSANDRTVVVASPSGSLLRRFSRVSSGRYATGLSLGEQLFYPLFGRFIATEGRAFETTHAAFTLPVLRTYFGSVVDRVRRRGGSVHVFLTPFPPFPAAVDADMPDHEFDTRLRAVLDAGVDGIMTDHPARVAQSLKRILNRGD